MNNVFSNFNFDTWLKMLTSLLNSGENSWIDAGKFYFENQIHQDYDEFGIDLADMYLTDITRLHHFMKYISLQKNTLEDIVYIIVHLRYPMLTNHRIIAKVLLDQKSYKFNYNGTSGLVPVELVQKIKQFIQDLQIPIH